MARDAVGKAILAAALKEDGIQDAENGKLAYAIEKLDAAKAWHKASKRDAKADKRDAKAAAKAAKGK